MRAILPGGGTVLGAAVNGALGSAASQGVGVATGIQDRLSLKGAALTALAAGVGVGISSAARAASNATALAAKASTSVNGLTRALASLSTGSIGASMASGMLGSALSQGVGVATGLQDSFSWAGVAAAGVGAGLGRALGGDGSKLTARLRSANGGGTAASRLGTTTAVRGASLLANAATRSAIEGTSFARNVAAGLPDVIAQTLVDVGSGLMRGGRGAGAPQKVGGDMVESSEATSDGVTASETSDGTWWNPLYWDPEMMAARLEADYELRSQIGPRLMLSLAAERADRRAALHEEHRRAQQQAEEAIANGDIVVTARERAGRRGAPRRTNVPVAVGMFGIPGGPNRSQAYAEHLRDHGANASHYARFVSQSAIEMLARQGSGGDYGRRLIQQSDIHTLERTLLPRLEALAGQSIYQAEFAAARDVVSSHVADINLRVDRDMASYEMVIGALTLPYLAVLGAAPAFASGTPTGAIIGSLELFAGADQAGGIVTASLGYDHRPLDLVYNGASRAADLGAAGGALFDLGRMGLRRLMDYRAANRAYDAAINARHIDINANLDSEMVFPSRLDVEAMFRSNSQRLMNEADTLFAARLPYANIPPSRVALERGNFADRYVRDGNILLRDLLGLGDDVVRINRRLNIPGGSYRIPDLYFPLSTNTIDYSYALKTSTTQQIADIRRAVPNGQITIIAPINVRPSYHIGP